MTSRSWYGAEQTNARIKRAASFGGKCSALVCFPYGGAA